MKLFLIGLFAAPLLFSQMSSASSNLYEDLIIKHSNLMNLDSNLVRSVIYRESAFNPNARSHKNAQGLMQVIPSTAKMMGVNPKNLYDPEQNIIAGTRYLAYLANKFNNDFTKVVAGYNSGHGAVEKYNGVPPYRETIKYVRLVTERYNMLVSQNSNYQQGGYTPNIEYKNTDIRQLNAEKLAAFANQSLNQGAIVPVQYSEQNNSISQVKYQKRSEAFFISDLQNPKGGAKSSMLF